MPKTIDEQQRPRGRPRQHHWQRWFARGRVVLIQGRDYHCTDLSIERQARTAASLMGLRLEVESSPGRLVLTVRE